MPASSDPPFDAEGCPQWSESAARSLLRRDCIWLAASAVGIFGGALAFDLGDLLIALLVALEAFEIDELVVVAFWTLPGIIVVLWRHSRRTDLARHLAEQLRRERENVSNLGAEIAERYRVEDSLRTSIQIAQEQFAELDAIYNSAPVGLGLVDADLCFLRVNDRLAQMNGVPRQEHVRRSLREVLPDLADQLEPVYRKVVASGEPVLNLQLRGATAGEGGQCRDWVVHYQPVAGTGGTAAVNVMVEDVTQRLADERERARLEATVHQIQRVDSLGLLVGGVAHDFNNLLTVILGFLQVTLQGGRLPTELQEGLQDASRAAQRAAGMCRELLAFSGRAKPEIKSVDLGELLRQTAKIVRSSLPLGCELAVIAPEARRALVEGDEAQLCQVLLNLVLNAGDAVQGGAGLIELFGTLDDQGNCHVHCRDNGTGMDAATAQRIFEPFFTTKPTGRGLGLAAVQGIVRGHGGSISVRSKLGEGTDFTVILPVHLGGLSAESVELPGLAELVQPVLLVDDDPVVLRVTTLLLQKEGLDIDPCLGGPGALARWPLQANRYSGVIVDYNMPNVTGLDLYRAIRRDRQSIPVIICSGSLDPEVDMAIAGDDFAVAVHKPFPAERAKKLLRRLSAAAASSVPEDGLAAVRPMESDGPHHSGERSGSGSGGVRPGKAV